MNESEVQEILCEYFQKLGYSVSTNERLSGGNRIDIVAKSAKEEWYIEVKGDYEKRVEQYGTNFDTGMGQLLKSIVCIGDRIKYAIGIPISTTERGERLSYRLILPKYSKSVIFEILNLHMLLVRDDGSVEIIKPAGVKNFFESVDSAIRNG